MALETEEDAAKARIAALPNVSRETMDRLEAYLGELERWNKAINLVARNEISRLWSRHALDSLGLLKHLPPEPAEWLDIGSGGGFPAIPLAIVSRETSPTLQFRLVESDQRKAAFLREVARKLDLRVVVDCNRIEKSTPTNASLISARALAEVKNLLSWTENHRANGAKMMLLKGERALDELTAASSEWHMRYQAERHPLTLKGYILIIREAKRATFR